MSAFDKVIGYANEKEEMLMLCDVLKNKEKYTKFGIKIPKAVLLYGEPGLGKTLMAKAFIKEAGRKVFLCQKDKPDGQFVDKIRATFEDAIKEAPSIIFFDDMDKFAEDNLQQNCNKEEFVSIQTGLEEIDDKDVFVITTANDIRFLPDSLLREGRFGKKIEFTPPTFDDSIKIIEYYISDKHISTEVKPIALAHILRGSSCAVLESVINQAGIYAAYDNRTEIQHSDIKKAVSSIIIKQRPLTDTDADTKLRIAYHEAGHAVLNILTNVKISCLAIGKCGENSLGIGICYLSNEEKLPRVENSQNHIMTLLAGRASVEIQFNEIDAGATTDLTRALREADTLLTLVGAYGLEYAYTKDEYCYAQSQRQLDIIQDKKNRIVENFYNSTKALLVKHKKLLDALAAALFEKELLLYDEIIEIVREYQD